jgi:hypothetical protein
MITQEACGDVCVGLLVTRGSGDPGGGRVATARHARAMTPQSRDLFAGLGSRGAKALEAGVWGSVAAIAVGAVGPGRLAVSGSGRAVPGHGCGGRPHHPGAGGWRLVEQVEFAGGLPQLQHGEGVCGVCLSPEHVAGVVSSGVH